MPGHARAPLAGRTPSTSARTGRPAEARARRCADTPRSRTPPRHAPSSRRPGPGDGRQGRPELRRQSGEWLAQRRRAPHDHQRRPRRCRVARRAIRLAQASPRAVALHGVLELTADREARARRLGRVAPEHDQGGAVDPSTSLEERLEVGAGGQPLASRKATRYTVSRLRPFARRRLSTLRPPFVLMRSRKPCVFARRRRLG